MPRKLAKGLPEKLTTSNSRGEVSIPNTQKEQLRLRDSPTELRKTKLTDRLKRKGLPEAIVAEIVLRATTNEDLVRGIVEHLRKLPKKL